MSEKGVGDVDDLCKRMETTRDDDERKRGNTQNPKNLNKNIFDSSNAVLRMAFTHPHSP